MPSVSSFSGLLFDPARVGPLAEVTAPPYDIVGPELERRLHQASPYNVVRLILGRAWATDDHAENKYTRAASLLREWEVERALVATPRPAWFPYRMRFRFQGHERIVRGLICQVELEPLGGSIVPHEETLPAPFDDRLALLSATRTNLSPVYALYRGPGRSLGALLDEVQRDRPAREATDEEGVGHELWVLQDQDGSDIPHWLANEQLLIADGHHRYRVALAFREQMRSRHGPGPWDHMMMLLVDAALEDPPVLPIHRVLLDGMPPAEGTAVRDLAEILVTLRDEDVTYGTAQREGPEVIHRVASLKGDPPTVCALHEQVLADAPVRFVPEAALAEEIVRSGDAPAAFFLPPTRVERIRSVIERGERLPQKSTYFWPKPRTGMVVRPLR